MTRDVVVRTGAWYADAPVPLSFPDEWDVTVHRPRTPAELSDDEIARQLEHPVGQAPIRELARGRSRPMIVVDDLTRPTPAHRVVPHVLRHLSDAGIPRERVSILLATGTHGAPPDGWLERKCGDAAAGCRVLVHDDRAAAVRLGTTSFGSPVLVNPEAAESDLLIGIGGVYPQHTVGFGGGAKLVLGILARRSIVALHFGHRSVGGTYDVDNDFRRDLEDMSRMVRLDTVVSVLVDADRRVVRVRSGDHYRFFPEEVAYACSTFAAPLPGDADVVIANAYPMDVSATFVRSKGMLPLAHAASAASRVAIASCPEGIGYHGLFPHIGAPRYQRQLQRLRRLSVPGGRRQIATAALRRVKRKRRPGTANRQAPRYRTLLFTPSAGPLPDALPGVIRIDSWDAVLGRIRAEQGDHRIRVVVYPCSPLQVLQLPTMARFDRDGAAFEAA